MLMEIDTRNALWILTPHTPNLYVHLHTHVYWCNPRMTSSRKERCSLNLESCFLNAPLFLLCFMKENMLPHYEKKE
eukprot:m.10888 g.10888  ORF g.10888 m.10888 type:complete len:76 (+) comp5628_c0_seq2:170-397(+)